MTQKTTSKIYPIALVALVALVTTMIYATPSVLPKAYAGGISVDADLDASDAVDVDVSDNANDNDCNVEIIVKDKKCEDN
jgi:hypothetical protein